MISKARLSKIALISLIAGTFFYLTHFHFDIRPQDIRSFVLSFGWWGPVVFFLIYTIGPIIFFPTSVLSLGAGLAFGVWPGVLYIIFGASGAAITGYVMARFFGKSVLKVQEYAWSKKMFMKMEERGFTYILVLRLIPLVSFDLLSYAAGIAKVRFKSFFAATVIGMIPGTFVYSFLGSSIASGSASTIIVAIVVFLTLLAVTFYFRSPVKKWLGI